MNNNNKLQIAPYILVTHLRALVLALGESSNPGWWKTEFLNETGLRYLERIYPRTFYHAALHAAGSAACEVHDKAVGRIGVYHLFRLPESLEVESQTVMSSRNDEFFRNFRSCLGKSNTLMEMLASYCADTEIKVVFGPKRVGTDSDAMRSEGLAAAATVYLNAFKEGKPAFPYFAADQNGVGIKN